MSCVLKNLTDLVGGHTRKPFNKFIDFGTVVQVLEKCCNRHTRITEHPSPAYSFWIALNRAADR